MKIYFKICIIHGKLCLFSLRESHCVQCIIRLWFDQFHDKREYGALLNVLLWMYVFWSLFLVGRSATFFEGDKFNVIFLYSFLHREFNAKSFFYSHFNWTQSKFSSLIKLFDSNKPFYKKNIHATDFPALLRISLLIKRYATSMIFFGYHSFLILNIIQCCFEK